MLWALQSCSTHWGTWYWWFGFGRKAFLSIIFPIIKFVCQKRQTGIHVIISFLFVSEDHKHILLTRIHNIHVLALFPPIFLELKFFCQTRKTWNHIIITFHFVIRHTKHIYLIRIHSICALGSQKKNIFSTIFRRTKVCPSKESNMDSCNNLLSFCYGHMFSSMVYKIFKPWFCKKSFFPPFPLE